MVSLIPEKQFAQMTEIWNELLQSSSADSFFLRHEWMYSWWQSFGDDGELFLFSVTDAEGNLVAIAPLCIILRRTPLQKRRILSFIGSGPTCPDYLGFIIRKGHTLPALAEIISYIMRNRDRWDEIAWESLSIENPDNEILFAECRHSGLLIHSVEAQAYAIRLPESFDDYFASLSKSRRSKLRRERMALEGSYQAEFQEVFSTEQALQALDRLYELHKYRAGAMNRQDGFADPRIREFHRSFVAAHFAQGLVRIYTLSLSGTAQAILYVFVHNRHVYGYQSGINSDFYHISLGSAVILFAIEKAILSDWLYFDFLRGEEQYKLRFSNIRRPILHLHLYRDTFSGRMRYGYVAMRHRLGQILEKRKKKLNSGRQLGEEHKNRAHDVEMRAAECA